MADAPRTNPRSSTLQTRTTRSPLPATLLLFCLLDGALGASQVHAQSWTAKRSDPTLWQVVSIDRTGEPGWPYGREDLAGDGLALFQQDEQSADLRAVYADADADRLWLRAFVASTSAPTAEVRAYFFLDSDARDSTGGKAQGDTLDAELGPDPTSGGYEVAVGIDGNEQVLGAWRWDTARGTWLAIADLKPQDVRVELGASVDPIQIGAARHGYLQTNVLHSISGLGASCGGTIFARTLHVAAAGRNFSDQSSQNFACRAANDGYGDPAVLRGYDCTSDDQCPADGRCRDGICLFTYPCTDVADCRTGESCTANSCVRVVTGGCGDRGDCDGLVCQDGRCVACSETGARACDKGLLCSPNGACVNPDVPGNSAATPGDVQGGPFSCSAAIGGTASGPWLWLASLGLLLTRRRRKASLVPKSGRPS